MNFMHSENTLACLQKNWHRNALKIVAALGVLALVFNYYALFSSYVFDLKSRYIYNLKGDNKGYLFGLDNASLAYPEGAVHFMRENGIKGNIFNVFNNGAYLIFYLYPDCKVFIDGRTELYKGQFMFADIACLSNPESIENIHQDYNVNCVILPCEPNDLISGMFDYLYKDMQWSLVFFDGHSLVFLKNTSLYKNLIKANEIDLGYFKIEPEKTLMLQAEKHRYYPAAFFNASRFFLKIDMPLKALELLDYIDNIYPGDYEYYNLKGVALAKTGKLIEALYEFEKAAKIDSQSPAIFKNIGILYLASGQPEIARRYFEEGLGINPGNKDLEACLDSIDNAPVNDGIVPRPD